MSEFKLSFFGGLQLTLGGQDLQRPLSVKAQGLICYLAMTGRPQPRLALAGMFWGEKPEADALRSLRVDLTKIRKTIKPYIDASRLTLEFTGKESCWIDTVAFDHHLRLVKSADGAAARTHLREAAQLYTGDFLEGYQAGDAYGFEEWMIAQRESYRAQALAALEKLVESDIQLGEYEAGIESASQILKLEPWHEGGHRSLMWLYVQNGQRGAALRQYEICRAVLEEEVGVEPEAQTVDLWQQIKRQDGSGSVQTQPLLLPKAAAEESAPFQAPSKVPFFSGRDAELDRLLAQIEAGKGVQLFCLSGMGGVGKTALGIQLAHQYAEHFADGVLWADAASDPATIAERWAVAYGYDFRGIPRLENRLRAVREMLAEKQALIVIDDVSVAARVRPLIPEAGESVVLATTRNAEIAHALGAELWNMDVLTPENGRSLLSSIIGETRVNNEQIMADEICRLLQNLPLALAIAGQYLVARPRRQLADFSHRLRARGLLDVGDEEGIVRASFDISWTALDHVQQRVFALLAVFAGRPFTAEAMAHIAGLDFYVMQDHLDMLVARSLLAEQGRAYYRQHALLAHFADEKLENKRTPSLRMVDYYSSYTDEYGTDYQKLGDEWDNLDAAIQLMADERLWQTLFRVNQNLNQAWFAQGLFDRAQRAYQLAYHGALTLEDDGQIGENLYQQGMAVLEQGQYDEARAFFEQALTIFEEMEDEISISDIQYDLARIYLDQDQYQDAEHLLSESFHIKKSLNDYKSLAQIKYRQARMAYRQSDYSLASELANEAMEMQEELGETLDLIRTLRQLVWIHSYSDDHREARDCGNRALILAKQINDRGEIALALYCLAEAERRDKNYDQALNLAKESLGYLEQMGDIRSQSVALLLLAVIQRLREFYEDAIDFGKKSLILTEQVHDRKNTTWALGNIGWAYLHLGNSIEARNYLLRSKDMAQKLDDEYWVSLMDSLLAEL